MAISQRCEEGDRMEIQKIQSIIAQAKNNLNAAEGVSAGQVADARQIFIGKLGDIIMQQSAEIEQLKAERNQAPKVPKEQKTK